MVVEVFDAGAVGADVVGTPAAAELVAAGGQLADQVVEALVVRVLPGRGAEVGDRGVRGKLPVGVKPVRGAVKEGEPGEVRGAIRVVVEVGVKRTAEEIGGEQVGPVVSDNHRPGGDGVEGPLQAGPYGPVFAAAAAGPHGGAGAVGCLGQVEQVGSFGFVQLEGAGDRIKHAGGHPAE